MTSTDHDEPPPDIPGVKVALDGDPATGDIDPSVAATAPPEVLAESLGEYTRLWLRKVRSGESGALPVVLGLIALGAYFRISQPAFLSATNIANLMAQAGWIITIAMAQVFVLLLGEIDLSVGFNAAIGGTITVWMVSVAHPLPAWLAVVAGLAATAAIGG